jgi:MYND finger
MTPTPLEIAEDLEATVVAKTTNSITTLPTAGVTTAAAITKISEQSARILNAPVEHAIRWINVLELSYCVDSLYPAQTETAATNDKDFDTTSKSTTVIGSICFACGQEPQSTNPLKLCGQCRIAGYCSKECQVRDWKIRHKRACSSYQRIVIKKNVTDTEGNFGNTNNTEAEQVVDSNYSKSQSNSDWVFVSNDDQCTVRNEFFGRTRFYICPYAVFRYLELGRGFLFIQTNHTLIMTSLAVPIDCYGRSLGMRSCTVHYLTVGEYDQEICRDDFEMAIMRNELHDAVTQYDPMTQIVLLLRFRCGHVALGIASLVPDYKLCQRLGRDYYASNTAMGALQLNLDDTI